jgi:regulation of enolase protein 1 (concanavalin A-like superfamily)
VDTDYKKPHTFSIDIMKQEQEPLPLIRISYNDRVLREVPAFGLAQGQMERKFRVGLMGCSPMSNGCTVHFDEISIEGAIERPSAGDNCHEASANLV